MKSKIASIFLSLVMVASIFAAFTQNLGPLSMNASGAGGLADSPWPMFRQNLNHTGRSPYDTSSNPGFQKWNFTVGDRVGSSPVIGSDGTIYVGSEDSKLYAINPNGTQKWNYSTQGRVFSTPAIGSDGTIYVGSCDGKLYAINNDGTQRWNFATERMIYSSPAIGPDGTIYIGSADSKFYAIYPNGTEKWNFSTKIGSTLSNFFSSPSIGSDGTIYIGCTNSKLYAINPDGTQKWNFTVMKWINPSPAIGSDGTIYFGSWDNKLYAVNPNGTQKWNFTAGSGFYSSPAIGSDGTIYTGCHNGVFYAINPNGTQKWNYTTGADIDSSPAISSDGTIYVGSDDHKLYAINPNGTQKWNFTTGDRVVSSPTIGSDGTIYVGSYDNNLYAIGTPNIPPVADAGPGQTVNKGDEVEFNGSGSYDPDGTIETYEWDFDASDGLWWETGELPDAFGPVPTYSYNEYGIFIATLRVTDNNGSMDIDTCEITVLVPRLPPILYINVSLDGNDVILNWDPPSTPGIDHYLLYRSTSQIGFDFNTVWVNTSKDNESGESGPIPLRTMWNDTKAALPDEDNPNYEQQYYYIIRAVNVFGEVSRTSRTIGKWTKTFPQGVSTFSLPLEPLEIMNTTTNCYLKDMNVRYIKWIDPVNHIWRKHGDGVLNDTQIEVGMGYEVAFDSPTNYTFTGMPGAMIRYDNDTGFLGFDPATEAKNLTATSDPVTGNVTLKWPQPSSMDIDDLYHILRSSTRDGFWNGNYVQIATLSFDKPSYTDIGNATGGTQFYYMIVPINESGVEGASTYSIGVWTASYSEQYDTIGIPLKITSNETADWYCNNIPDTVGINYFIYSQQRWGWHSARMPKGTYDPLLMMTQGYQISTSSGNEFTFIGV